MNFASGQEFDFKTLTYVHFKSYRLMLLFIFYILEENRSLAYAIQMEESGDKKHRPCSIVYTSAKNEASHTKDEETFTESRSFY